MNGRLRVELEVIDRGDELYASAFLGEEYAGYLHLVDRLVEVVEVEDDFRRKGIATELLRTVIEAGYPVEHNWDNLTGDGFDWLESVEPEKTRLCRTWDAQRRQAAEQSRWDFPSFEEWLAERPQLGPLSAQAGVSCKDGISVSASDLIR